MPKNGDFRKNLLDRKNVQERMVLFFFMGKRLMEHGDAMMNLRQGILKGLSSINGNVIGTVVIILCELKNLYWLVPPIIVRCYLYIYINVFNII